MAKRFTDTDKYKKAWFRKLSPKLKCFWDYITSSCDNAGVWEQDWDAAGFHIGDDISIDEVTQAFGDRIMVLNDNKILVVDFIEFQYGELSEKSAPHRKVLSLVKKHKIESRVLDRVASGLPGSSKEEEKEKEEEEDKEEEKEKVTFDFLCNAFDRILAGVGEVEHPTYHLPQEQLEDFQEVLGHPKLRTRGDWEGFFTMIAANDNLTGIADPGGWVISFDWLVLSAKNINKVFQGGVGRNFGNKTKSSSSIRKHEILAAVTSGISRVADCVNLSSEEREWIQNNGGLLSLGRMDQFSLNKLLGAA